VTNLDHDQRAHLWTCLASPGRVGSEQRNRKLISPNRNLFPATNLETPASLREEKIVHASLLGTLTSAVAQQENAGFGILRLPRMQKAVGGGQGRGVIPIEGR